MSLDNFEAPSLEALAALLPSYDFEAFIAKGGMGAVYKARQRRLDRDVAIKILPRELGEDAEFVASFETEARAMAKLNHPNLISVFDYGEVDGMPYIVMEYVNGKSLFHSAENLAVDPGQAVGIVKGICDGLAHAHENGVIHRDIKPANILLTPRAAPKIGDFGLARPVDSDGSGLVMGTPGYVAPEVLRHPEQADRRSDLFALGVVLYELLIGRCPPYDGYIPPSKLSGCDTTLDRICEKAMNPVAEERYQTAEEMSADLEAWLRRPFSPLAQPYPAPLPNQSPLGPRRHVSADPVHPAAAPRTVVRSASSSSSGAVAGLVMLAIAIVVGAIAWSKINSYRKARAAAIQEAVAQGEQSMAAKDPEKRVPTAATEGKDDKSDKAARPVVPRAESPLKALARLKSRLRDGKRDEMPEGSVALGSSHFMVIPTAMGWPGASAFAEEHGAHLFVAKSDEDLEKLALLMPAAEGGAEAGLWIGGGSAGPELWSWVDGSPWSDSLKPEGEGPYLILDGKGGLQAREPGDRYPFAIQWREDGKNPAVLAEMLKRSGESIGAGVPVYPPGTLQHEQGRIFVANGPSTYSQAAELAATAGGELLSASTKELDDWLSAKLPADGRGGYWLGGTRGEEAWTWANGDAWDYTRWSDESQAGKDGGRLKVVSGQGWENADSGDIASGFVVAWPSAARTVSSLATSRPVDPPVVEAPLPPALAELEEKAKQLLANLGKDRDKELAANAKTFHWDLDTWMNNLSKNEVSAWRRDVAMLKQLVRDNRVPAKIPSDGGFRMSDQMRKVVTYCAQKQQAIDKAFEAKASKIRDSYVSRLNAAIADAAPDVAAAIKRRVEATADLDRWTASLGVGGAKAVPLQVEFKVLSAIYGTGGKDADVTERVRELLIKERRAFRVSPSDLGADPNPGWNKGLTVKYTVNGTERSKSWGENSEVKPEDLIPAESALGEEGKDNPLLGVWRWFNGVAVVIWRDGSAFATNGNVGEWEAAEGSKDDGKKNYRLKWFGVSTDVITIGNDTDRLTGKPVGASEPFECTRRPADDLKKSPERGEGDDPVVGSWLWTRGGQVMLLKDGTVQSMADGNTGTWKLVSGKGAAKRKYEVEWPRDGFVDSIEMHESGRAMNGRSNNSWDTHAIRLPD